jgi:hypothetical protein
MITDFTLAEKSTDLVEYYKNIYDLHSICHTSDYVLVHHEIERLLENCESYTEFGVMQGATLAAAMLTNIKSIRAYDINLKTYEHAARHFEIYASQNDIDFTITTASTLDIDIDITDLLYIDTFHSYPQLSAELKKHHNNVQKYIVCHDTHAKPRLAVAIAEFIEENKNWEILTENKLSVGYTVLERS